MRFRLVAPGGAVLDEGEGDARVETGALVVVPELGQPLRIRPIDVLAVDEPAPYTVSLRLTEGPTLEMSQIGPLRTQILADFATVRSDSSVDTFLLKGLGTPVVFPGAVDEVEAEVRVYDDVLVAVPQAGDPQQVRLSFVDDIKTDASGYRITVSSTGRAPLDVHRLASRTTEFLDLLRKRVTGSRLRSATLVNSLLPALPSLAGRTVATMLRDGVPARFEDLDAIEPTISTSLVRAATLPDRVPCVEALRARGPLWFALHQRESVEVSATGGGNLSAKPIEVVQDHGGIPSAPGGYAGVMAGSMLAAGPNPFGLWGPGGGGGFGPGAGGSPAGGLVDLAVLGGLGVGPMAGGDGMGGMLGGAGASGGQPHQQRPRATPDATSATAAHTDYDALSATGADSPDVPGEEPTAFGMVFAAVPSAHAVVYEVLNDPDHATYVYDLPPGDPADGIRQIAAAMGLIGFRVSAIYQDASGVDSKFRDAVERLSYLAWLRDGFRGRAIHTEGWEAQLDGLLAILR
jgi:hypothetical protein